MISRVLILCFISLPLLSHCQYSPIKIGKRKNIYWSRAIKPSNLGNINTYYYPIYFRAYGVKKYKRIGLFGHKLKPILNLNDALVSESYRSYKRSKKLSYSLAVGSIASLFTWVYFSGNDLLKGEYNNVADAYLKPKNIIFLGAHTLLFACSVNFNLEGDRHLSRSIKRHNKLARRY